MDDRALVEGVLKEDRYAISMLIDKHQRLVLHVVRKVITLEEDVEEIAQDIFIKVIEKIDTFNYQSKLSTWIATVAYRQAVNFNKRLGKHHYMKDTEELRIGKEDGAFEQEDAAAFVRKAIDQLPEHYRVILTLFHIEGFSYPEMVEVLDLPEGTVKNYLFRARNKLKEILLPYLDREMLLS